MLIIYFMASVISCDFFDKYSVSDEFFNAYLELKTAIT
jgi:hypothetical protein